MAAIDAETIEGDSELLNRYGLERCLSISTIFEEEEVKPPDAPPIALPNVEVTISILSVMLKQWYQIPMLK